MVADPHSPRRSEPRASDCGAEEFAALNRRCEALEAEVAALRRSGTWRLTAPARLLLRVVTGRPDESAAHRGHPKDDPDSE